MDFWETFSFPVVDLGSWADFLPMIEWVGVALSPILLVVLGVWIASQFVVMVRRLVQSAKDDYKPSVHVGGSDTWDGDNV